MFIMAKNLVTLNVENVDYSIRPMMTATIENDIIAVNAAEDFEVVNNASIAIKPTNTTTVNSPSLLINGVSYPVLKPNNIFNFNIVAGNIYELMYDGTNSRWVILNYNANTDLQYITYSFKNPGDNGVSNDSGNAFILIAELTYWGTTDWIDKTDENYSFIGTIYNIRGGNQAGYGAYNITMQATSYKSSNEDNKRGNQYTLYVDTVNKNFESVLPYIVKYNDKKYLALRKKGSASGRTIHFHGLTKNILPEKEWIFLTANTGKEIPEGLTILYEPNFKDNFSITTEKYYDGSNTNTLLHSGNYADYTVKKDGTGATGTWGINISGHAVSAEKAGSVNNNLVIKLNGGSTEGTNKFSFDGSAAKTIDITPSSIGADLEFKGTTPISASKSNKTVTISHNTSGVTAGNYGETNNKSVLQNKTTDYQNSFNVPYLTVDDKGHITQIKNSRITLPTNMDTDVEWSTKSLSGTMSPIDIATDGQWSANRLSFMPIRSEATSNVTATTANSKGEGVGKIIEYPVKSEDVIIEYTENANAGENNIEWKTYPNITDADKTNLITTGLNTSLYLNGNGNVSQDKDKHRLRITLTAQTGKTYFSAKKLYIYLSTSGATNCKVLVEQSKIGVYPNTNYPTTYPEDISQLKETDGSNGKWETLYTCGLGGWAGWNSIPFNCKFGGSLTQTGQVRKIRLTFYFEGYGQGYGPNESKPVTFSIMNLAMIGETSWSNSGGSLATTGHLYKWNINKDAFFPRGIVPNTNNTGFLGSSTHMWQSANIGTIYENNTKLSEKYAAKTHSHSSFETLTVTTLTATNLTASKDVKFNAGLNIKNDINFTSIGNADKFISFKYNDTPQFGWRIGYLGVGQGENNFLAFQSGGIAADGTWTDALKFGCNTLNATFAGNILPSITNTKDLGTSSLSWNNVYAKTIYESGNSLSNTYAAKTHTHDDNYYTQAQTDKKLTNLQNLINALSSGLKVTGSASPSTFFTGVKTSVTVTATVQNVDNIDDATITINGITAEKNTTNKTASVTFDSDVVKDPLEKPSSSKTYSIVATVKGMLFNSSASVTTKNPIFYGMDEAPEGYPKNLEQAIDSNSISYSSPGSSAEITGILMKRDKYRTSARDYSYERIVNTKYSTAKFFLLVPKDVALPVGFTMGGAPFDMSKIGIKNYTINGNSVEYHIYRSGSPFGINGAVTLSLAK